MKNQQNPFLTKKNQQKCYFPTFFVFVKDKITRNDSEGEKINMY